MFNMYEEERLFKQKRFEMQETVRRSHASSISPRSVFTQIQPKESMALCCRDCCLTPS